MDGHLGLGGDKSRPHAWLSSRYICILTLSQRTHPSLPSFSSREGQPPLILNPKFYYLQVPSRIYSNYRVLRYGHYTAVLTRKNTVVNIRLYGPVWIRVSLVQLEGCIILLRNIRRHFTSGELSNVISLPVQRA